MPDNNGFFDKMRNLLGGEYPAFCELLSKPPFCGIRVNTLKCGAEKLRSHISFSKDPTPFCNTGYYIENDLHVGRLPAHHAGAFYVQEPSASSAVTALDPKPFERILDLCAAPGGKSTAIAAATGDTGLLWCNEFVSKRVPSLISNIERIGVKNAVVTSARPDVLCDALPEFFDRILVDAPCSGEGMMRKNRRVADEWSQQNVEACAARQARILDSAAKALRPGGVLVYSTCTFSPEENERTVAAFLKRHPDIYLEPVPASFGRAAFARFAPDCENITLCRRIFPMDGGEGHFIARMKKAGDSRLGAVFPPRTDGDLSLFNGFFFENFLSDLPGHAVRRGDKVYITPELPENIPGLIRAGLLAGIIEKGRFSPAHALYAAAGLRPVNTLDLSPGDNRLSLFLQGGEIPADGVENGWVAVSVDGMPLSFGKASNGVIKNHYPKGLRNF